MGWSNCGIVCTVISDRRQPRATDTTTFLAQCDHLQARAMDGHAGCRAAVRLSHAWDQPGVPEMTSRG